ncbi:MAG: PBSX family phage terminase large subunit [Massilioclostridium sp.]|nr:PBSX family phage terminase large subunit [Massilioclostridium sp.]
MGKFKRFSQKQKLLLSWWCNNSSYRDKTAIICDGAVRSGKTSCMSLSFVLWAFTRFDGEVFGLCGKTILSLRRNVVAPLLPVLRSLGYSCEEKISGNYLDLRLRGKRNRFYLFGGKDEGSAALIQGVTLAGVLCDEVALMPRSFVEQAIARCSVAGSKLWFNCNPEHPFHWFYLEWIQKAEEKNALYLHFRMEDNPSLSPALRRRYETLYSGAFYERFVLGHWTAQSGQVYPMFDPARHVVRELPDRFDSYYISCDYGITNPASFGLWGCNQKWYRIDEYYFDSRREQARRTDEEYYAELERLAGGREIRAVIADPSASSWIECIRRHGKFRVIPANNDVQRGISLVSDALREGKLLFSDQCADSIREFSLYCWEENSGGDRVKKQDDHAMDDIRYFVSQMADQGEEFFVLSIPRGASRNKEVL